MRQRMGYLKKYSQQEDFIPVLLFHDALSALAYLYSMAVNDYVFGIDNMMFKDGLMKLTDVFFSKTYLAQVALTGEPEM